MKSKQQQRNETIKKSKQTNKIRVHLHPQDHVL